MTQYGFYFDNARCTGCKTCEMACKDYKDLPADIAFRKVYEYVGGEWTEDADGAYTTTAYAYHLSLACNHCSNPACVEVCPTGAMHKDENGLVSVDSTRCIGCGYCHFACPYAAPKVNRELGYTVKCDGCKDRVAEGKKPICVEACPLRALDFGDIEELRAAHGTVAGISPMPEPSYTYPNIVINPSAEALAAGDYRGTIINPSEVE